METKDIKGFESYYTIDECGNVFSKRMGRMIKLTVARPTGYVKVWLTDGVTKKWHSVHRLVLDHFVGSCPSGFECHHKDHDKENNCVGNLEWISHSENILRSFQAGRDGYWKGKERGPLSSDVRAKMAEAKNKPILAVRGDRELRFKSIGDCAVGLLTYREKVYRRLRDGNELDGWKLEYL